MFPSASGFLADFLVFRIVVSSSIRPLSVALLLLSAAGIHFVARVVLLFPVSVVLVVRLAVSLRVLSAYPFSWRCLYGWLISVGILLRMAS